MKLVTFTPRSGSVAASSPGIVLGDRVVNLDTAFAWYDAESGAGRTPGAYGSGLLGFIENVDVARPAADMIVRAHAAGELPNDFGGAPTTHASSEVTLLSPLPRPPSMRDGYAFRQHVLTARKNRGLEMIPEFDQFPVFYFTNHQAVIGPGELRVQNQHLDRLDFELEAAIVVGKRGRNVPAARADELVFGLTIMNDFSARGLQMEEMKLSLGPAKGKDFATALGPWLVTVDELLPHAKKTPQGAAYDLGMRAFVNGKQVSAGNVKDMTWTFAQILERASYGVTLYPGDVIGSGTCGTGCFLELNGSKITDNQWLRPGDVVALEVDALGRLENKVVLEEEATFIG
jgi:fumarylacetoacetate (FAA) hydrolase